MAEGNKYYQQLLNDDLATPKNNDTKKLLITYFDNSKGNFFSSQMMLSTHRKSHIYGLSHLWSKDQRRHVCNALSNEANDYIIIKRIT